MNAPNRSPYDSPELYDLLFDALDFDIPFWQKVAREANGPVLEIGCGTGRVLLRLLESGFDADGLDLSEAMVERFRTKARPKRWDGRAFVGDMKNFSLARCYARVICAFNSFAHCETTDDQLRALHCFRAHLLPGGALVLHMSYPGPQYWSEPDGIPVLEAEAADGSNGRTIQMWDTRTKDPVAQLQRSEIEIRELDRGGRTAATHRFTTLQRWVYRFELELLLRLAGFSRWRITGGFDDRPLAKPDEQMLAWAWSE